jgi:TolB-like protein/Flp pilus assembly protein TadD
VWRYYEAIEARSAASAQVRPGQPSTADAVILDDPRPSVAVLPFENRSASADDAYFADAIQDDILTQLTKVPSLRVIASTSVEQLRGSSLSTQEIGRRLGVAKLLQGRVQREGDRVRINVALVDAATGSQDWAERYDRSLTGANILAIQSGVAATVAARLQAGLPAEAVAAVAKNAASTGNIAAWDAYHRGQKAESPEEAEQLYRQAIQADPKFARAYVGLSRSLVTQIYARGSRRDVILPEAEAAAETALQLEPGLPEAWVQSGWFFGNRGDAEGEEARIRKAIELSPNYAHGYESLSDLMFMTGRLEEAVVYAKKGVALDPLSPGLRQSLAHSFEATRRYDEAEAQYRRAIELDPTNAWALSEFAEFEAYTRDRFALAVTMGEKAIKLAPDTAGLVGALAGLYMDMEDDQRAAELLDDATSRWPDRTNVNVAAAFLARYRGDQLLASRLAGKILETQPRHPAGVVILSEADLARGDLAAARAKWSFAYPELFAPGVPKIDTENAWEALQVADILLASKEGARAQVLIDAAEQAIRNEPVDIRHVELHMLRGEKAKALEALREMVKSGWHGPYWRAALLLNRQLIPLHAEPVYEAAVAEIRRDMAKQRAELAAMRDDTPTPE